MSKAHTTAIETQSRTFRCLSLVIYTSLALVGTILHERSGPPCRSCDLCLSSLLPCLLCGSCPCPWSRHRERGGWLVLDRDLFHAGEIVLAPRLHAWLCHDPWRGQVPRLGLGPPPRAVRWCHHQGTPPRPMWAPGWLRPTSQPSGPKAQVSGPPSLSRAPLPMRSELGSTKETAPPNAKLLPASGLIKLRIAATCTQHTTAHHPLSISTKTTY